MNIDRGSKSIRFYQAQPDDRDFLERYLKLTHCDLFSQTQAILVEGNVEDC